MPRATPPGLVTLFAVTLAASPSLAAGWQIDDTISPLDGARTYAAQVQSNGTIPVAGTDQPSTFIIRCKAGVLDAYVVWPESLGAGPLDVRWHTDSNPASTAVWSVSPEQTATFSENARAVVDRLKGAHTATFQVALADSSSLTATFDVAGADPIVATATKACGG